MLQVVGSEQIALDAARAHLELFHSMERQAADFAEFVTPHGRRLRAAKRRLARAWERCARERAALLDLVAAHTEAEMERKPALGAWSAAETLEHLSLVEGAVLGFLRSPETRERRAHRRAWRRPWVQWLPARLRLALLGWRFGKARAPQGLSPCVGASCASAQRALVASRAELRRLVEETGAADLLAIHRAHPILGDLDGIRWIEFLAAHDRRHRGQIRQTLRRCRNAVPAGSPPS